MNAETVAALLELNRRFYGRYAAEFSASRQRPWPGWDRLVDRLAAGRPPPSRAAGPLAVLDVGCGNGRFASYLAGRWPGPFSYLGLDSCPALLEVAAERLGDLPGDGRLRQLDLTARGELDRTLGSRRFDLIALFGVLHHLPGSDTRRSLLLRLARHLAPSGLLAASIWQRHRRSDFAAKVLPWSRYNRRRSRERSPPDRLPGGAIAVDQLERGDTLLTWAGDATTPRYCHFPGGAEIAGWCEELDCDLADRFEADGSDARENLYLVFTE
jgi:SAM-dependent methyltransferase